MNTTSKDLSLGFSSLKDTSESELLQKVMALTKIAQKLKMLGWGITILIFTIFQLVFLGYFFQVAILFVLIGFILSLTVGIIGWHDLLCRQGNILFEELSHDFEINRLMFVSDFGLAHYSELNQESTRIMRLFSIYSDMPMLNTRNGSWYYLALLLVTAVLIFIVRPIVGDKT